MALLELTVSAQVEAYMNVISVYNKSGSRLENSGGDLCSVTEMLTPKLNMSRCATVP